jgi:hypothetical protein
MALRGVGIGTEKNQLCAVVADDNRVAGQVDVDQTGKLDDVFGTRKPAFYWPTKISGYGRF